MKTFDFNDKIQFLLPDDYTFEQSAPDVDGNMLTAIRTGKKYDGEGNTYYDFDCRVKLFVHNPSSFGKGFTSDRLLRTTMENLEKAKYCVLSTKPAANLIHKKVSFPIFGIQIDANSYLCVIQVSAWRVLSLTETKRPQGDPNVLVNTLTRLMEVANAVRLNGKEIPFSQIDVPKVVEALDYDDDDIDGIEDVTADIFSGDKDLRSVGKVYRKTSPHSTLYPHYRQHKNSSGPVAPGVFMITNATGTEYEFIPLSKAVQNNSLPYDEKAVYQRAIDEDTGSYDLADRVSEIQRLFHVNASVFNEKRDRECEIDQGLLHRAYMMSALRSFAWTLADYCETNSTDPDSVPVSTLNEIVSFCAKREWLNYNGNSHCRGLCCCSDLHVFYVPDAISKADRKKLMPSDELIKTTEQRKATIPYYNPILDEVNSLDSLREDLAYIYPAIRALSNKLAETRNYNEALTGNEADIVYAWCSLAKAAKEPFYTEDGPMHCYFTQMKTKEETAAEWEENAERNKEEWLNNYGHAVEKTPDIQFEGKIFVFSGVDSDEVIDAVLERGGQQRSKISGITNYLIVDPRYCGESKTYNAIEQQKKGKPVKIILLDDLKAALEGETTIINQSSLKSSFQSKIENRPNTQSISQKIPADFPKGKRIRAGKTLVVENGVVIKYKGKEKHIILPSGITAIGSHAFEEAYLYSVVIPEGVTSIGDYAFGSCTLQAAVIPEGVTEIGKYAFLGSKFEQIHLPNSLKSIGEWAFSQCEKLSSIELPEGLCEIGEFAFNNNNSLRKIQIPTTCSVINEAVFYECSNLEQVILHNGVTSICNSAFQECPKLKEIDIPEKAVVGGCAFDQNVKIRKRKELQQDITGTDHKHNPQQAKAAMDIRRDMISEPKGALVPLSDLTIRDGIAKKYKGKGKDIILPSGIRAIGKDAFSYNKDLHSVVVPEGVTRIGDSAFYACSALKQVSLPSTLETIEESAFRSCTSLNMIHIPAGVKKIGEFAFWFDWNLMDIFLPESIKSIGSHAFLSYNYDMLVHAQRGSYADRYCKENNLNTDYGSFDEYVPRKPRPVTEESTPEEFCIDGVELLHYSGRAKLVVVPDMVRKIDSEAFRNNLAVERIIIPTGIQSFGYSVFNNCEKLESIVLNSATDKCPDFTGCKSLVALCIPYGVKAIGGNTFMSCDRLEDLYLPPTITIIDKYAFIPSNTVCHVAKGSYAEQYAKDEGLRFDNIIDGVWKEYDDKLKQEREQSERNEKEYQKLIEKSKTARTVGEWSSLASGFIQMKGYKDSQTHAKVCADTAAKLQKQIDEERRREMELREERRKEQERVARDQKRNALENEKKEQEAILQQSRGLGALFGDKAKKRKAAQERLAKIEEELSKL